MPNQKNQYYLAQLVLPHHNFQKHAEFTLIEQIRKEKTT